MSTVDLATALKVVDGHFPEDRCRAIYIYRNAWNGISYKIVYEGQRDPQPSDFLRQLTLVWTLGDTRSAFEQRVKAWTTYYKAGEVL